ncbi:hypothetical protein D7D26_09600 [Pyramidobacter sp. CG50-2]|nr:hypothetical protein D7D26_09600 [Pyramidobacter sp. CG50-2]
MFVKAALFIPLSATVVGDLLVACSLLFLSEYSALRGFHFILNAMPVKNHVRMKRHDEGTNCFFLNGSL